MGEGRNGESRARETGATAGGTPVSETPAPLQTPGSALPPLLNLTPQQQAALAQAASVLVALLAVGCSEQTQEPFDSNRWKAAFSGNEELYLKRMNCVRGKMTKDLFRTRIREGVTYAEIVDDIGPADKIRNFDPLQCYYYDLGYCSDSVEETDYARICVDERGKIQPAKSTQRTDPVEKP